MVKELMAWLRSDSLHPFAWKDEKCSYIFVRVPKNEDFDYLFCQQSRNGNPLTRESWQSNTVSRSDFDYVGMFFRGDGLLYDNRILRLSNEDSSLAERSVQELTIKLETAVRKKVEEIVDDNKDDLKTSEVSNPILRDRLESQLSNHAEHEARYIFLFDAQQPAKYECRYKTESFSPEFLMAFIANPDSFVLKEASQFLEKNQEDILYTLLCNEAIMEKYREILSNPDDPIYSVKRIMQAVSNNPSKTVANAKPARTVRVTISREGKTFSFRTAADIYRRDCMSYYNTWYMGASDLREFEKLFGDSKGYYPQEITTITYRGKVLYSRN